MARYRFSYDGQQIEIDLKLDGGKITVDGREVEGADINPQSLSDKGDFRFVADGSEVTCDWSAGKGPGGGRCHTVRCNGVLVLEVELYDWLDI